LLVFNNIEVKIADRLLFVSRKVELKAGVVALVGRNGSGKSTFIRTILGDHELSSGVISLDGGPIEGYKPRSLSKKIAVVYSKPQLFGDHSVQEVLLLGRIPHQNIWGMNSQKDLSLVQNVAKNISIEHLLDKKFQSLSDGEKQLVMIGRAFCQSTDIIILDEPAAFLDVVNRKEVMALLKKVAKTEKKLVIFSTHHVETLQDDCDQLLLIENKEMIFSSNPNKFKELISKAFKLES